MPAEFTLLQQGKGSNASPFLPGGPVALQSCHHKTCRHSSERRKMTWPLTLWRLHLEDTSLPPPCLYLEVCSASHSLPWHIDVCAHTHTHAAHSACWLTRTTDCSTSQTPFQICGNWLTTCWGLAAGRQHMLYLPTSRGLPSTLCMWYG